MRQTGKSADGDPVYSEDDPADFLYWWMRQSWPAVLSGRRFDLTGDTAGFWLCAVSELGRPLVRPAATDQNGRTVVHGDWPVNALVRPMIEDSNLNPLQVFALWTRELQLVFEAKVFGTPSTFRVTRLRVRPITREGEALAHRYGANWSPHEWTSPEPSPAQ